MKPGEGWLDTDPRDAIDPAAAEAQRAAAVDFARLYDAAFVKNSAGAQILEHWVKTIEQRDVPPTASHAEYAHWESRRSFVRGIQRQIELARTEGRQ